MKTSESTANLFAALAAAQGELKNPETNKTVKVRTRDGRDYSYEYATLPLTFDVTRAALSKHGISHSSATEIREGHIILTYRLSHKSGEWIQSEMPLPNNPDPKGMASNLSYFRRYLFNGLVGIAGDEDTDGEPESGQENADKGKKGQGPGSGENSQPGANAAATDRTPGGLTESQLRRLTAIQLKAGLSDAQLKDMAGKLGIESRATMTKQGYDSLCKAIEEIKK